ncbi:MAG: hypothetical protein RID53_23755 [Coleofasciculus sp. B1-GNL1-01]|uniref:hypothetical protein n=1 Tax=Coleofasciculus sp. B1-GNL1-01 TaxID=3068484 RepID=UPI0032F4B0D5
MDKIKEHKDLLEVAEHFFADGKLMQAISYATASLDLTISVAKGTVLELKHDESSSLEAFDGVVVQDEFGKQKVNFQVSQELQKMQEILLCYALKIDYEKYFRYRTWVGYAVITGENTPDKKVKLSLELNNIEQDQARTALDYCQQLVQQIESKIEQFKTSFS